MDLEMMQAGPLFYYSDSNIDRSGNGKHLSGITIETNRYIRKGVSIIDLSETRTVNFNYGFMNIEGQKRKWSLGCWFRKHQNGFITGRNGDGFWAGSNYLRTKIGNATIDYPVTDWTRSYLLFLSYSEGNLLFYVNGVLVGEAFNSQELQTTNIFSVNLGLVSDVIGFNKLLRPEQLRDFYEAGTKIANYQDSVLLKEPTVYWAVDFQPIYTYSESTTEEFLAGINQNVEVLDDLITLNNYQNYEYTGTPRFGNGLIVDDGELVIQL